MSPDVRKTGWPHAILFFARAYRRPGRHRNRSEGDRMKQATPPPAVRAVYQPDGPPLKDLLRDYFLRLKREG